MVPSIAPIDARLHIAIHRVTAGQGRFLTVVPQEWSDERKDEFVAGRKSATRVLSASGYSTAAVPRTPVGAPLWPCGIVGSISHSARFAVAVVARSTDLASIGVDIEAAPERPRRLPAGLFSRAERDAVSREPTSFAGRRLERLLLCAKESTYKCMYQLDGTQLTFGMMCIQIVGDGQFSVHIRRDSGIQRAWPLRGYFRLFREHWLTLCAVEPNQSRRVER